MSISRKKILRDQAYTHLTFRCLNREFFFKPFEVKNYIIKMWGKYKERYGVKIYEFIIMDNHAHLLVHITNAHLLGDFMRITNAMIAKFINKLFSRDSHALKERYKSPLISNEKYLVSTMQYIWLNREKIGGKCPSQDPYCSYFYRSNSINYKILDDLAELNLGIVGSVSRWVVDFLNAARGLYSRDVSCFEHQHTIGDYETIELRRKSLRSIIYVKQQAPPM